MEERQNMLADPQNSDREEGEIIEDGDLSDISSEEEYLLRERLCILENYNYALERKEAKRLSLSSDTKKSSNVNSDAVTLSEISDIEIDKSGKLINAIEKHRSKSKLEFKQRRQKEAAKKINILNKERPKHEKKFKSRHQCQKPKHNVRISESSEESADEYKNKRRKLHNAVRTSKSSTDQKSLKDRITSMISSDSTKTEELLQKIVSAENFFKEAVEVNNINSIQSNNAIVISSDENSKENSCNNNMAQPKYLDIPLPSQNEIENESDVDLEALRQSALSTKKPKSEIIPANPSQNSEEDSDTTELRLICLKSSLLKRAIEIKQKQKLKKKLNKTHNDSLMEDIMLADAQEQVTDNESMDMEVSDNQDNGNLSPQIIENKQPNTQPQKQNDYDLEEDEDLLRAKLLTSLSNSLPKFQSNSPEKKDLLSAEKKIIINLGESDSCSDNEATENLTKMHMRLEQLSFQERLDLLLKGAREETIQKLREVDKPSEKFVPKAVNHLPPSDQKEYHILVKRMAELEKMKKQRQVVQGKTDTNGGLETRNSEYAKVLQEKISESRRVIAADSAKVLNLKEEGKKLSQRYSIALTELRNLKTALALNKKELILAQKALSKKRIYHNNLVRKSSILPKPQPEYLNPQNLVITVDNNDAQKNSDLKDTSNENLDDYISPLVPKKDQRLIHDPNVILCKFELAPTGCRDKNCKFLHLKS